MNDRKQQQQKDSSTRRFSTDDFDCEPPREAVEEMLRTKRARTFRSPPDLPTRPSRLEEARRFVNTAIFAACGLAFIFAMIAIVGWALSSRNSDREILTRPVPVSTPAVIAPTPRSYSYSPAPVPTPAPLLAPVIPDPVVRRAELAVKRAEFVGFPVG
jgi:hypothetical protein